MAETAHNKQSEFLASASAARSRYTVFQSVIGVVWCSDPKRPASAVVSGDPQHPNLPRDAAQRGVRQQRPEFMQLLLGRFFHPVSRGDRKGFRLPLLRLPVVDFS